MITLDPHDGDLGISSWVDCYQCIHDNRRPGWVPATQPGWFAIRVGERHWIDRATYRHYHVTCGVALVDQGLAEIRDVAAAVTEKKRLAKASLRKDDQKGPLMVRPTGKDLS